MTSSPWLHKVVGGLTHPPVIGMDCLMKPKQCGPLTTWSCLMDGLIHWHLDCTQLNCNLSCHLVRSANLNGHLIWFLSIGTISGLFNDDLNFVHSDTLLLLEYLHVSLQWRQRKATFEIPFCELWYLTFGRKSTFHLGVPGGLIWSGHDGMFFGRQGYGGLSLVVTETQGLKDL